MEKLCFVLVVACLGAIHGAPGGRILEDPVPANLLTLPSNATSIRANIEDSFSCDGRQYGYYADVENDCQLFHVCLPVTYSPGRSQMFRWSFICPEETVFNQEMFTCTRADEAIDCLDSPRYYNLNTNFGEHVSIALPPVEDIDDDATLVPDVGQELDTPEIVSESAEAMHVTQQQEYAKSTVPIVPIYHRRVMKF